MKHFNFLHKDILDDPKFIETLIGKESYISIDDNFRWEDVWIAAGLFSSKSEAKRNNHSGSISPGMHLIEKKKRNICVFVYVPTIGYYECKGLTDEEVDNLENSDVKV